MIPISAPQPTPIALTQSQTKATTQHYTVAPTPNGEPQLFTVALPEGNYNITVTFGGPSAGVTTVRAEARRLMLEKVATKPGERVTRTFTVNVHDARIAGADPVKLKARDLKPTPNPDWDGNLSLEFTGDHPAAQSVDIASAANTPTVFILGDSTVTDQTEEPWAAWGQMLPRFFAPGIAVANYAESGASLRSTVGTRRFAKVVSLLKTGDFVLIQFGHNDQKEHGEGVGAFTTYAADLRRFVEEIRQHGGTPVLVTSMNRRRFDAAGKIVETLGDYPEAVRRVAREATVPLIDLNALSRTLFEAMGPEGTLHAFVHYPANTFPGQKTELKDDTHFNNYGAYELAQCVIMGIRASVPALATKLSPDAPTTYDPAHPDALDSWNLPPSPVHPSAKPEGN